MAFISPERQATNVLGFLINIDWFQPYKRIAYSVGVIYAVIANLPRNIRYKDENVIIIGVIPAPKEPKKHVNSYLEPLVSELLELSKGLGFTTSVGRQFILGALVCLSADIPATRKAAGFVSHNALKGSQYLKQIPMSGDHIDYSGFQRESWPPQNQ